MNNKCINKQSSKILATLMMFVRNQTRVFVFVLITNFTSKPARKLAKDGRQWWR